jgi:hypothetical protein
VGVGVIADGVDIISRTPAKQWQTNTDFVDIPAVDDNHVDISVPDDLPF